MNMIKKYDKKDLQNKKQKTIDNLSINVIV